MNNEEEKRKKKQLDVPSETNIKNGTEKEKNDEVKNDAYAYSYDRCTRDTDRAQHFAFYYYYHLVFLNLIQACAVRTQPNSLPLS